MKNKIKSKTEIALKWNAGYKFLENLITFAIGIFLARLLDPSEFGIIAVVLAISSFVNSFVDGGFGSAIVQSKQLKETDLSSIFTLNLIIAITFSTLLFLLSGFIGELFENKIISEVSKAITLLFLFQAFIVVPKNFLVRNVDFKSIAIIELISIVISGVIAVILAINGFKYWALALRVIIQFLIAAILYNLNTNLKLKFELNITVIKKYWLYSINVLSNSLFVNLKTQFDIFILGKLISSENLGLYSRGKQYATIPQLFLYMVFNKPLFSAFSKIDEINFVNYYNKWYNILSFITIFSFFSLFIISDEFINLFLGKKWEGSIIFLKIFSFWGIFKVLILFNFDIFNTKGKPKFNLMNSIFEFFVFIILLLTSYITSNATNMALNFCVSIVISNLCSFIFQNYQLRKILKETFIKNLTRNFKEVLVNCFSLIFIIVISRFITIGNLLLLVTVKLSIFITISFVFASIFKIELFQLIIKKINK